MMYTLVQSALVAASFLASAHSAAAQGGAAVNQLQMARLPQPAQRAEFPLAGEESAFKFSFLDDVRIQHCIDLRQDVESDDAPCCAHFSLACLNVTCQ